MEATTSKVMDGTGGSNPGIPNTWITAEFFQDWRIRPGYRHFRCPECQDPWIPAEFFNPESLDLENESWRHVRDITMQNMTPIGVTAAEIMSPYTQKVTARTAQALAY